MPLSFPQPSGSPPHSESIDDPPTTLTQFSPHLFWDVGVNDLDWDRHARFVIGRVLELGTLADWYVLKQHYGIRRIAEIAKGIRSLNQKAATFIAVVAHIPREQFACYTTARLTQQHWIS